MSRQFIIFDLNNLSKKKKIIKYDATVFNQITPHISFASTANLSYDYADGIKDGKMNFWLGLIGSRARMNKIGCTRSYQGNTLNEYGSYAMKMQWSAEEENIRMIDDVGIHLDKEYILTLSEYSPGSVAITCDMQASILNFVKGKKYIEIKSLENLNIYKSFLEPFPGNKEELPFIICAGNSQIQLVNVQTNTVQTLINRNNQTYYG